MEQRCSILCNSKFIVDRSTAEKLGVQINEALTLLSDYNDRLSNEVDLRKKLSIMLKDFIYAQKELLVQAERGLEVSNLNLCFV